MTAGRTIEVIGSHEPDSGLDLLHRRIVTSLRHLMPDAEVRGTAPEADRSFFRRLRLEPTKECDVAIITGTPMPLRIPSSLTLSVVCDLRWNRSRSRASRAYRRIELSRVLARSDHIFTISHAVSTQLEYFTHPSDVTVLRMGPGQLPVAGDVGEKLGRPGIVLIGRSPHKENERAAALLADLKPRFPDMRVTAVSTSDRVKQILRVAFDVTDLVIADGVSADRLAEVLRSAHCFVHLGSLEGFGFPYVEAMSQGCVPVVRPYSVAREVVGSDGIYLDFGDHTAELAGLARALERVTDGEALARGLLPPSVSAGWAGVARPIADYIEAHDAADRSKPASAQ